LEQHFITMNNNSKMINNLLIDIDTIFLLFYIYNLKQTFFY